MPKISIITASYNYANFICKTIESIQGQSYDDWEMIIVDDGSKDDSIDIINEYVKKDSRIKLYMHENGSNKGLIKTLQLGIEKASGEYIAFLESDDYVSKDYLEKKLVFFEKLEDVSLIYNDVQTIGESQTKTQQRYFWLIRNHWRKNNYPHFISDMFYIRNYVPTFSCVMLKKYLLKDINWNSPDSACIDWWIWAQISKKTKIYFIPEKLTFWRLHKDSYLNVSVKDKQNENLTFLENLYEFLPPISKPSRKVIFLLKQIYISIKYKKILLKFFIHAFKHNNKIN